jgi:hypothetical protein
MWKTLSCHPCFFFFLQLEPPPPPGISSQTTVAHRPVFNRSRHLVQKAHTLTFSISSEPINRLNWRRLVLFRSIADGGRYAREWRGDREWILEDHRREKSKKSPLRVLMMNYRGETKTRCELKRNSNSPRRAYPSYRWY